MMSKPRKRIKGHTRSCRNKQKFDTLEQADRASRMPGAGYMQAYKCKKCKKYHYGHVG